MSIDNAVAVIARIWRNDCIYCGMPKDTPERAHKFIHEQGEAIVENVRTIRAANEENAALREALRWALTHAEESEHDTDFYEQYAKAYRIFKPEPPSQRGSD